MPDGLYDRDFLAWAEHQAALLRRMAAGERLNEAVDWPNLIEEVEALGRSEFRACESFLVQVLAHVLKLYAWPGSNAVAHWRGEIVRLAGDAQDAFSPSMQQKVDLGKLYRRARNQVLASAEAADPPRPLPQTCPFELDELLGDAPNPANWVAKLANAPE